VAGGFKTLGVSIKSLEMSAADGGVPSPDDDRFASPLKASSGHLRFRGGQPASVLYKPVRALPRQTVDQQTMRAATTAAVGCSLLLASFLLLTLTGTLYGGVNSSVDGARRHEIHLSPQLQSPLHPVSRLHDDILQQQVRSPAPLLALSGSVLVSVSRGEGVHAPLSASSSLVMGGCW
jgi:hypothetical protein